MKFSSQLVMSSLAVLVLSACSGSPTERRQARDDFEYLNTPDFEPWVVLPDAKREFYPNYQIPEGDFNGPVGQSVDIRPPQQILELIPGARSEISNGEVLMWLLREDEVDKIWKTILEVTQENDIALLESSDNAIETDWLTWVSDDEEYEIGSRYRIERFEKSNRFGFKIALIEWQENGQKAEVSKTNRERYNIFLTNMITSTYDQKLREEAQRKAEELVKSIPISMGTDRSGLPVIIARAQYNVFWQRMIKTLPEIGFKLEERNQSQGVIKALYFSPDDEFWQSIGIKPLSLDERSLTFLFGDLGNRTSINITDSSGKPVAEEVLNSIAPVIGAVLDKQK